MEKWRCQRNGWLRRHGFVDEHGWANYSAYTRSPHWKDFRRRYFDAHPARCYVCSATDKPLTLHHLNYKRIGQERFSDVAAMCRRDHELVHDKQSTGVYVFKDGLQALQRIYLRMGERGLEQLYTKMVDRGKRRRRTHSGQSRKVRRVRVLKAADLTPQELARYGFPDKSQP